MPWNEPGNKKPNNSNRPGGDKPPDFDEVIGNFLNSVKAFFGGSGGSLKAPLIFFFVAIAAFAVWNSAYRIDQPERGVVLIFGKYSHTMQPGLNFTLPPPLAKVYKVNVETVRQEDNSGQMLTEDKNLIEIDYSIQYRIDKNKVNDYLFNISNPQNTVSQAAESAMRQVAGTSTLDHIVNENRTDVNFKVQNELQNMLNTYNVGIDVQRVNITEVHPPKAVKEAFDDVVKAREDQKTYINEAKEYAKQVIPEAEGKVLKVIQESEAYKESVIAEAKGQATRFDLLLKQYAKAPEVTRKRMYLETMSQVLGATPKLLVDSKQGGNMLFLPLEQMLKQSATNNTEAVDLETAVKAFPKTTNNGSQNSYNPTNSRTNRRGRGQ